MTGHGPLPLSHHGGRPWSAACAAVVLHGAVGLALFNASIGAPMVEPEPAMAVELIPLAPPPAPVPEPAVSPPKPAPAAPRPAARAAAATPSAAPTPAPAPSMATAPAAEGGTPAPSSGPAELPLTPPSASAAYLANPRPHYPPLARKRGWEGTVVLAVAVDAEGRAGQVEVRVSSGHALLDRCAETAVREWRFVPARRGERTVAATVEVPIRFSLTDEEVG